MNRAYILPPLMAILCQPAFADWSKPSKEAVHLAKETIIVDGHIDVPYRIQKSNEDVGVATEKGDFDYPRAKAGGLDAPFMAIYVAADYQETGGAKEQADTLIDLVEGIADAHPDKFEIAHSVADVKRIAKTGRIALPMGMENGAPVEDSLDNLDHFYERGVRYITLAHSRANQISDSSYDINRPWDGLSPFGEEVVARMNDLGIMVDISHISDAAFFDTLEIVRAPVIASHSSARKFTGGFERNMSDDMIKKVGENNGVIMINFGSSFLTTEYRDWVAAGGVAYQKYLTDNGLERSEELQEEFGAQWRAENPAPFADVDDVLDHIDHVVDLIGINHVGLGSDYDGVGDSLPAGLKDASTYPNLVQGLMDRGYSKRDIRKILSGNVLRVWSDVEKAAL
ncbi:dipeptidase [Parvularcula sp. LCG005]|nr:dipeptidase [Parvularcula sp. LCG005]WOI53438.1 dipeptidase [Parvularcula sp. LCG005]